VIIIIKGGRRKSLQQVIYADVLIFINTVITFLLLLTVKQFTGAPTGPGRLVLAAFAGGAYSLVILAPEMNFFLVLLSKAAMCVSIVFIAFRAVSLRKMLKSSVLFLAFSFLYAGIMYSLSFIFSFSFVSVNNGSVYFDLSVYSLIIITLVIYGVIRFLRKLFFTPSPEDMIYRAVIYYRENSVNVKALLDTGNSVRDVYTGKPVIILSAGSAQILTGEKLLEIPEKGEIPIRFIPVKALSGSRLLPAFTAERAVISFDNNDREVNSPCVAVTDDSLGGEKYQALISGDIF